MRASRLPRTTRRLLIVALVSVVLLTSLFFIAPAETEAAGIAPQPGHEIVIPMAPADEGGGGLSGSGASEWIPFAVMLGPFVVVITGLLWLTFRIDADEVDED